MTTHLVNAAAWAANAALTALFPSPTPDADNRRLRRDLATVEKAAMWLAGENVRLQGELDDQAELVAAARAVLSDAVDDVVARSERS